MNTCRHRIAICLGAAVLGAFSALRVSAQEQLHSTTSANDNAQVGRVAGTVVRSGTDEPLRKARVTLSAKDDKNPSPRGVVTGADGKFAFEGLTSGAYDLEAEHDGYVTGSYGENADGQGSAVLTLATGQKVEDLIFRLRKCAVISGHVVDEDGDPVQGVTVEAVRRTMYRGKALAVPIFQSSTNDLGEYRLFDLEPGQYCIRATPSSQEKWNASIADSLGSSTGTKRPNLYVPTFYPDATDILRASTIELKEGNEIPSMDVMLVRSRTYKIRGQVVDLTESSVDTEFAINLLPLDGSQSFNVQQMTNVKDGSFELDGLSPGSYQLIAMGLDDRRQILKGFERVEITNADVDSVRVMIKRGVEIRGRVAVEGKAALPKNLTISLQPKENDFGMNGGTARVKADATFEIPDVHDGLYQISASSGCEECYLKSARMNGIDLLEKGLEVAGAVSQPLELLFSSRSGTVEGIVTKDDDLPAVGAKVLLVPSLQYRQWSGRFKTATTDQYGRFTIRCIAPGDYKVFAIKQVPDDADVTDPEFIRPFESQGQKLSIDENGKKTLQLKWIANDAQNPRN
jgi:hypothetical protein